MIGAFFESVKYSGHLYPIAFLRIFLGYYYFNLAFERLHSGFLDRPILAAYINEALTQPRLPMFFVQFLSSIVVPQWEFFAKLVVMFYFALGVSYLIGYLVRPMAVLALGASLISILLSPPQLEVYFKVLLAVHLTLLWLGAGRCFGFDYYFFKRRRGLWW